VYYSKIPPKKIEEEKNTKFKKKYSADRKDV
jgi:hypothetical protein